MNRKYTGIKTVMWAVLFLFSITSFFVFETKKTQASDINLGSKDTNDRGGQGKAGTWWKTGDYGVRFTLVKRATGERISRSIDYYKLEDFKDKAVLHTGGKNKLEYIFLHKTGFSFKDNDVKYKDDKGGFSFYKPDLWNVISTRFKRKTTLKEIKKEWLSSDKFLKGIAKHMGGGITLDKIKSRENMLIFEPMYYFHMDGKYYGLTATEIALYDMNAKMAGKKTLRMYHTSFSHKAIPLSAYLKKDKYNIKKYNGVAKLFSDEEILAQMGVGMVSGKGGGKKKPPKAKVFNYRYNVNTEVYTSIAVLAEADATPENPITVEFDIPGVGKKKHKDIYLPKGKTCLAWVKWTTPKTEQDMTIGVTVNGIKKRGIEAEIVKEVPWEPLNPTADDVRPINASDFSLNADPKLAENTRMEEVKEMSWDVWEAEYQSRGDFLGWRENVIKGPNGKVFAVYYTAAWDEDPYWALGKHEYRISYSPNNDKVVHIVNGRIPGKETEYKVKVEDVKMSVVPASTARKGNPDEKYIKSGYGIEADIKLRLKGNGVKESTGFQTAKYFFPEFNYKKYWRLGERRKREDSGFNEKTDTMMLPQNFYSYSGYTGRTEGRFHFLPIWYPDGKYKVHANVWNCWTPAGEIKVKATGHITCKGALWDDWHIQPIRE